MLSRPAPERHTSHTLGSYCWTTSSESLFPFLRPPNSHDMLKSIDFSENKKALRMDTGRTKFKTAAVAVDRIHGDREVPI